MRGFLINLLFPSTLILSISLCAKSQILTSELLANGNAEEIANKTYVQEQSELQRKIFRGYDRKMRPVQNQSQSLPVSLHVYLMHYSVDQTQQVITVNGHIYMTWIDELAVWDPSEYNNIRITMAKQWELWYPELRVANSVSGVNQYFEISKRSHASLTSVAPNQTKVEIYPTFAIRMGCDFDYSDYPFDVQLCALRLYTTNVMSEVDLTIFYNLQPSVSLGWGSQSGKRHISDWELVSVTSNMSYYKSQQYARERPASVSEYQNTWSIVMVWVSIKRNAWLFWISLALPAIVSTLINLFSFMLPRPEHSLLLIIVNFFVQSVFTRDAIKALPPAVGESPRIVRYSNILLVMTTLALGLHLFAHKINKKKVKIPESTVERLQPVLRYFAMRTRKNAGESGQQLPTAAAGVESYSSVDAIDLFRHCCFLTYLLISLCLLIFLF